MKSIQEQIAEIKQVANGMNIELRFKDVPFKEANEIAKQFDSTFFEPTTALPYYWTVIEDEGIKITLECTVLKPVVKVTFETV